MSENEKRLLLLAINGDLKAFERLIESYHKTVYNIALRILNNREDAEEAAQEAFIKAFRAIKGFKQESSFSTWIYRIVTNVCRDELRKKKNKKVIYLETKNSDNEDYELQIEDKKPLPDEEHERKCLQASVREALNSLPDDYKEILILRDFNDLSYEEISSIKNCPLGTIKSRINRARTMLKNIVMNNKELFEGYIVKKDIGGEKNA